MLPKYTFKHYTYLRDEYLNCFPEPTVSYEGVCVFSLVFVAHIGSMTNVDSLYKIVGDPMSRNSVAARSRGSSYYDNHK